MSEDDKIHIDSRIVASLKNAPEKSRKEFLRWLVAECWGEMPSWTTLNHPVIEEVQKATVGSGAVFYYTETSVDDVETFVLLAKAGAHYKKPGEHWMIPGGFMNLSRTPGSSKVPASDLPETPQIALARECEEELKLPDGSPLLRIDPTRFAPADMGTIKLPWGEVRIVLGSAYYMDDYEFDFVSEHVEKLSLDSDYRKTCSDQTINSDSGLPEIETLEWFNLDDVVAEKIKLLHADQLSLFKKI